MIGPKLLITLYTQHKDVKNVIKIGGDFEIATFLNAHNSRIFCWNQLKPFAQ